MCFTSRCSSKILASLFAIILCAPSYIHAQEFSFVLTFEDAIGNQDSITFGYAPDASDGIDVEFAEENIIDVDLDPVFDVRITDELHRQIRDKDSTGTYHLKRQILKTNCSEWPTAISIDIKCKYWPVTASWKMDSFVDSCNAESIFTSIPPGGWWDVGSYSDFDKVEFSSQETIEFNKNYDSSNFNSNYAYINQDGDTVSVFWSAFLGIDNVTVPVRHFTHDEEFSIFPNPTTHSMRITGINPALNSEIKIFDVSGKLQLVGPYKQQLDVGTLRPGIYYMQISDDQHKQSSKRFIKQ